MILPLDGPSKQAKLSVTASVVVEAKASASVLPERKVITLQPIDGKLYVYFGEEGVVPNAATVIANGFEHTKKLKDSYEASDSQAVYLLAVSGTVQYVIAERA